MIIGFFNISGGEIFIVLIVVFLIFGPDKIPEIARWIGKGVGEIKKATSEITDEITKETSNIKKEADELKRDLTIQNPLKKKPSDFNSPRKKDDEANSNPDEKKEQDPHL